MVTGRGASTVADPNPSNNSASVSTTVTHPDLVLHDLSVYPRRFTRGNGLPRLSGRSKPHPTAITFSLARRRPSASRSRGSGPATTR